VILDEIVRLRRDDVAEARSRVPITALRQHPMFHAPRRDFVAALRARRRAIIAEVKRASPSKGVIRADFDALAIARAYERGGAAAISVLTEERHFQGHLSYLAALRDQVELPLLRKDFIFDPYQLYEARAYGADAALLIVAMLSDAQLRDLQWLCEELNLTALVEVHDRRELERAVTSGARLIGINNRNLQTFEVTLATTEELAPLLPQGITPVGESGIDTEADIRRLEQCGVHAFLIGESLMRASDPSRKLAELLIEQPGERVR
jgi:indole-3-glycerol phosphate synthase